MCFCRHTLDILYYTCQNPRSCVIAPHVEKWFATSSHKILRWKSRSLATGKNLVPARPPGDTGKTPKPWWPSGVSTVITCYNPLAAAKQGLDRPINFGWFGNSRWWLLFTDTWNYEQVIYSWLKIQIHHGTVGGHMCIIYKIYKRIFEYQCYDGILISFYHTLSYFIIFYHVLSYFIMFYHVLS